MSLDAAEGDGGTSEGSASCISCKSPKPSDSGGLLVAYLASWQLRGGLNVAHLVQRGLLVELFHAYLG